MGKLLTDSEDTKAYLGLLSELEFAVGSCGLSRRQALIELGFPEEKVDELMDERMAEDVARKIL